jgi:hypothetical protein
MDSHSNLWPTLAALFVAALALAYAAQRADFVIRVRNGSCHYKGNLPLVKQKAVTQFLLDDLRPRGPVTVRGRHRDGRLRLWFRGDLTPGEKQRIRNFLLVLR